MGHDAFAGFVPLAAGGVLAAVLLISFLRVLGKKGLGRSGAGAREMFAPRVFLFTDAEGVFLFSLDAACAGRWRVFGKVRVADVIDVSMNAPEASRQSAFWSIAQKHVDFVLTDLSGRRILAAIELDDSSHGREDRRSRDALLNQAFLDAGIPLVRFPVQRGYAPKMIFERLAGVLPDPRARS